MTAATHLARDPALVRHHYEVERELADRLRRAAPADRKVMYRTVYNELFERVPDHPQLVWKASPEQTRRRVAQQLRLVRPFVGPDDVFLEIGGGDCGLSMAVAGHVRQSFGVDISDLISAGTDRPGNFALLLSDGTSLPLPDGSVDTAYSRMLLEHLHPDDAAEHLREVYRVLRLGGRYVCETPHRFTGPQDVSQYFDDTATGFHLKEYTFRELRAAVRAAGFSSTGLRLWLRGRTYWFPRAAAHGLERLLGLLPTRPRRRVAQSFGFRQALTAIVLVGRKGRA
jgi:SAM-dependent methyltransferase